MRRAVRNARIRATRFGNLNPADPNQSDLYFLMHMLFDPETGGYLRNRGDAIAHEYRNEYRRLERLNTVFKVCSLCLNVLARAFSPVFVLVHVPQPFVHTYSHRQIDRQTDRQTHSLTHSLTHSHTHTHPHTHTHTFSHYLATGIHPGQDMKSLITPPMLL